MFNLKTNILSVLCLSFAFIVCLAWSCASVASDIDRAFADNPGWAIQVCRRMMYEKGQGLNLETDFGRLLDAYEKGRCSWTSTEGVKQTFEDVGVRLPNIDWNREKAVHAWKGQGGPQEPFIHAEKEQAGTRVGFSPMNVADDLLCCISFLIIDSTPANADAKGIDFLAAQIECFGGRKFQLTNPRAISDSTPVDFWNSQKHKRYTVTEWAVMRDRGCITPQTYGPLLFDVINSEPDFMFIGNQKIALSPEFQAACRQLCDKVLELRKEQGQMNPPRCR